MRIVHTSLYVGSGGDGRCPNLLMGGSSPFVSALDGHPEAFGKHAMQRQRRNASWLVHG
jgi:hypothetical protein